MQPAGAQVGGASWRQPRAGLQLVFYGWLVNAGWGLLYGLLFNAMIEGIRHGGSDASWKMLDRMSLMAGFTDLAAMSVVALGMLLVGRASPGAAGASQAGPAQAGVSGLATGAFACMLGSIACSLFSFFEQLLETVKILHDPLLSFSTARYIYVMEAVLFMVATILFLVVGLKVAGALRAPDAAWKAIVAVVAIPLATLLVSLPMFVHGLSAFRMDNRWAWFLLARGIRSAGDLMMILFLAHLIRVTRDRA